MHRRDVPKLSSIGRAVLKFTRMQLLVARVLVHIDWKSPVYHGVINNPSHLQTHVNVVCCPQNSSSFYVDYRLLGAIDGNNIGMISVELEVSFTVR